MKTCYKILLKILFFYIIYNNVYAQKDIEKGHLQGSLQSIRKDVYYDLSVNKCIVRTYQSTCDIPKSYLTTKEGCVLSKIYRDIDIFSGNYAEVVKYNKNPDVFELHGFINHYGKEVIPPKYVSAGRFMNGTTWAIQKIGHQFKLIYIDTLGRTVFDTKAEQFSKVYTIDDFGIVYPCHRECGEETLWNINYKKVRLAPLLNEYLIAELRETKKAVQLFSEGRFGFIDKDGLLRTPVVLDEVDNSGKYSGEGLRRVRYFDKYGFVDDITGVLTISCVYDDALAPYHNRIWVKLNRLWGVIDCKGNLIIPFKYQEVGPFTVEGRARVRSKNKFGHIDTLGQITTPLIYENVGSFFEGAAVVKMDNKYGYVNKYGKQISPIKYAYAKNFSHGRGRVQYSGIIYEVDLKGEESMKGIYVPPWWFGFALILILSIGLCFTFRAYYK